MAKTWFQLRSEWYFGPKKLDFRPEIRFCYRTPFVALGEPVVLTTADRFFDFRLQVFVKNGLMQICCILLLRKIGVFCMYVFGMQNEKLPSAREPISIYVT